MLRSFGWLGIVVALSACQGGATPESSLQVAELLGGSGEAGFARATEARPFQFPRDHGPHPAYRSEWWYITGNLQAEDGGEFGFQITFFRIALQPRPMDSESAWRSNQIWMAHAALSDFQRGEHLAHERFSRETLGMAGALADPFQVWLEDWRLEAQGGEGRWQLRLPTDSFDLNLSFTPISPVVAQGDQGLSRKSDAPGNASHYYSIPRLQTSGRLQRDGQTIQVGGLAWLDREWSTSALGPEQAGWDWFSLQLNDGRNLMYYQLRRKDGGVDPHSSGSLSDARGLLKRLQPAHVKLTPLEYWRTEDRRYPVGWRLHLQGEAHPWRVQARFAAQEMRLSVRYWEGAVEVLDEVTGERLGRGYLEMAGYSPQNSGSSRVE